MEPKNTKIISEILKGVVGGVGGGAHLIREVPLQQISIRFDKTCSRLRKEYQKGGQREKLHTTVIPTQFSTATQAATVF